MPKGRKLSKRSQALVDLGNALKKPRKKKVKPVELSSDGDGSSVKNDKKKRPSQLNRQFGELRERRELKELDDKMARSKARKRKKSVSNVFKAIKGARKGIKSLGIIERRNKLDQERKDLDLTNRRNKLFEDRKKLRAKKRAKK